MLVQTMSQAAINQRGLKNVGVDICTFLWSSTVDANKRGLAVGLLGLRLRGFGGQ